MKASTEWIKSECYFTSYPCLLPCPAFSLSPTRQVMLMQESVRRIIETEESRLGMCVLFGCVQLLIYWNAICTKTFSSVLFTGWVRSYHPQCLVWEVCYRQQQEAWKGKGDWRNCATAVPGKRLQIDTNWGNKGMYILPLSKVIGLHETFSQPSLQHIWPVPPMYLYLSRPP